MGGIATERRVASEHVVYLAEFVADNGQRRFKIGITHRLKRRLHSIAIATANPTGRPGMARCWAYERHWQRDEAAAREAELLTRYSDLADTGTTLTEWLFPDDERMESLAAEMKIRHQPPSAAPANRRLVFGVKRMAWVGPTAPRRGSAGKNVDTRVCAVLQTG